MSTTPTTVKFGDTTDATWTVNANLTGATVRGLAQGVDGGAVVTLSATVVNPTATVSTIKHTLTGTLPIGRYDLEFEITDANGKIGTAPSDGYHRLIVLADLG